MKHFNVRISPDFDRLKNIEVNQSIRIPVQDAFGNALTAKIVKGDDDKHIVAFPVCEPKGKIFYILEPPYQKSYFILENINKEFGK